MKKTALLRIKLSTETLRKLSLGALGRARGGMDDDGPPIMSPYTTDIINCWSKECNTKKPAC